MSGRIRAARKVKYDWKQEVDFWLDQEIKLKGEKMTIKELASRVARGESKKTQASIGDIREILSVLSDMTYAEAIDVHNILYKNGKARAKKVKSK